MEELSSHEKKEQKKEAREEIRLEKEKEQELKQGNKNLLWIVITIIVFVAFGTGVGWLYMNKPEAYTDREVHWHALVNTTICGENKDFPKREKGAIVHGLLHTHDDNTIHIEGKIMKKEDIMLGKFFDAIEVEFDKDKIMGVKNGDLCNGKPGKLKMYVNDQPRDDFRDYILFATQDPRKQVIKLVFEQEKSDSSEIAQPNETIQ